MKRVYAASVVLVCMAIACIILFAGLTRAEEPPEVPRVLYGDYVLEIPKPAGTEVKIQVVYDGEVIAETTTTAQWGYSELDFTGDGKIELADAIRILQIMAGM